MKTIRTNLCLLLILTAQIYAQRFTAGSVDSIYMGLTTTNKSYASPPYGRQIARLGEINSSYANLMLVRGPSSSILSSNLDIETNSYNVVDSDGNVFGIIWPAPVRNLIGMGTSSNGDTYDNKVGAVLVLDSLNDNKKDAIALFSTLTKLYVTKITIADANKISYTVLKDIGLPAGSWQLADDASGENRRLALLGTSQSGSDKVYHIAISNPYSSSKRGRIDFFSLKKGNDGTWTSSQPNPQGLAWNVNGLSIGTGAMFGTDLVPIMDKNGNNALAVLLPQSLQHPQSAIYIFSMDNAWTPSNKPPIILTGNSIPWVENSGQSQNCTGLSTANWQKTRLLVACNLLNAAVKSIIVKDIVLDSDFEILNTSTLFSRSATTSNLSSSYSVNSNPLHIKKHKNYSNSVSIVMDGPASSSAKASPITILVFPVMDADYSKNYSIEINKLERLVNLDSLFYKSGILGFSAKTLYGLVQCEIQNNNLLCEGGKDAIGSWSALELSSRSGCNLYRECKEKDTIFVYVRSQSEPQNTALRIPKDIVIPFLKRKFFNNLESLSYFKNPTSQSTKISWDATGLKFNVATSNIPNELSIISLSQKENIDTIVFKLSIASSTNKYPVRLHAADSSKILNNGIPEKPSDNDTVWNTAQKRYIALPYSNSNGNIYTYDIAQNGLEKYAEIAGDYLHILKVEVTDISIAYTENSQIKHRKITLMPENSNSLDKIIIGSRMQNLKAVRVNGGLQINGLNGEFEIKAYNFKGVEIQRKRAYAQGSTFVKLEHNCPQIVQIKSGNQKVYMKVVN